MLQITNKIWDLLPPNLKIGTLFSWAKLCDFATENEELAFACFLIQILNSSGYSISCNQAKIPSGRKYNSCMHVVQSRPKCLVIKGGLSAFQSSTVSKSVIRRGWGKFIGGDAADFRPPPRLLLLPVASTSCCQILADFPPPTFLFARSRPIIRFKTLLTALDSRKNANMCKLSHLSC